MMWRLYHGSLLRELYFLICGCFNFVLIINCMSVDLDLGKRFFSSDTDEDTLVGAAVEG